MEDSLRLVSFLRDLTDEELTSFAGMLRVKEVAPGTRVIEEGTEVDTLYIVCSGVVHVRRLSSKHEMLLGRLGVGAFFGEINLFDPGVATASIYVMTNKATLAYIDYESLRAFLSENHEIGYKIVSSMMTETARRLRSVSSRLVNSVYWGTGGAVANEGK